MVIQSVQAVDGMSFPVCRYRFQFELPVMGQTTKFWVLPTRKVSPDIAQFVVVATESRVRG